LAATLGGPSPPTRDGGAWSSVARFEEEPKVRHNKICVVELLLAEAGRVFYYSDAYDGQSRTHAHSQFQLILAGLMLSCVMFHNLVHEICIVNSRKVLVCADQLLMCRAMESGALYWQSGPITNDTGVFYELSDRGTVIETSNTKIIPAPKS